MVETCNLWGHPKAKRCHAWTNEDKGETQYVPILEMPPVNSAETAVKVAIAANARKGYVRPVILRKRDNDGEHLFSFEQSIKESRRILEEMKKVTDARKRVMDQIQKEFYCEK